ncbi:MAG: MoaF N-terminal domain-containing protein [Actinomycetota bacterium]
MTEPDPIDAFDGKTISYTYDNGWSFTNTFDGHTRISVVPRRGELREQVAMVELRPGLYFASWIDGEMGLLAQIIDVEQGKVLAAIPNGDQPDTSIIAGDLTFDD